MHHTLKAIGSKSFWRVLSHSAVKTCKIFFYKRMNKDNFISTLIGIIIGILAAVVFTLRANAPQTAVINASTANPNAVASDDLSHTNKDKPNLATQPPAQSGMQPQVKAAIDAARGNPNDLSAQLAAATNYYQIAQYDRALEFINQALKIDADDLNALKAAGDANFDKGDYLQAASFYEQYLKQKPDDQSVQTDYGATFFERTPPDYERAIAEFQKTLQMNPQHEVALQNTALASLKKGDKQLAREAVERLATAHPMNQAVASLRAATSR